MWPDYTACQCSGRLRLKCDGTRPETRFLLSAKRTSTFKSAGERQFSRLLAAEVCASAVVMLDTPCYQVVWKVLATHSIRQFPLHFPSRASRCSITFQLDSTALWSQYGSWLAYRVFCSRYCACLLSLSERRFGILTEVRANCYCYYYYYYYYYYYSTPILILFFTVIVYIFF